MKTCDASGYTRSKALLRGIRIMAFCISVIPIYAQGMKTKTTPVDTERIPVAVQTVLAEKYPGWTVHHVVQEETNGSIAYRIRLMDGLTEIDVILDEGGHIVEAARGVDEARADDARADDASTDTSEDKPMEEKKPKIKKPDVYGFVQAFYRHAFETGSDGVVDNDNFRVQRVRLGVKGDISPWASYEVEIDPRAPEIAGVLRDAFIGLNFIPNQQIRIGQQKTTFGYENGKSSAELFAVNRTELSDNLSRGNNLRDIGVGLIGHIPLSDKFRIEDAFTVVNGAGLNVQDDNTSDKNVWGRLGVRYKSSKDSWWRLGVSGGHGDLTDLGDPADPTDDLLTKFDRAGVDLELDRKWFFLSTEYVSGTNQSSLVDPEAPPLDPDEAEKVDVDGYYVNLVGKTRWNVGPIARYDVLGEDFKRWTFGVYCGKAKSRFRVMVNYELRQRFEDPSGNIGRGDDKLYVWTQVRF